MLLTITSVLNLLIDSTYIALKWVPSRDHMLINVPTTKAAPAMPNMPANFTTCVSSYAIEISNNKPSPEHKAVKKDSSGMTDDDHKGILLYSVKTIPW